MFSHELQALRHQRGLDLLTVPGHRRRPDSWLGPGIDDLDDLQALLFWIPDIAERDVYLCGPDRWTRLVKQTLDAAGLPVDRLHLESFRW